MKNPVVENSGNLHERLAKLIGERVLDLRSGFTLDNDLYEAGLDSMAIMQLLLALEEEFGISIPVESVSRKNLSTIRALAELVGGKVDMSEQASELSGVVAGSHPADALTVEIDQSPQWTDRLPLRGADYFVLSFDRLSRKTGQGGHKAHSFLVLDRLPDVDRLREVLADTVRLFPMLSARLQRNWFLGIPYWASSAAPVAPELHCYSELGSADCLMALGAQRFDDLEELTAGITNSSIPPMEGVAWPKARFSLLEHKDTTATLIFSWSHLMMDGVGAELFLPEVQRIGNWSGEAAVSATVRADETNRLRLGESWKAARPIVDFFHDLSRTPIPCLGPAKPRPGQTRFLVRTLSVEETSLANARCAELCGGLVNMPFYLACAMRAHGAVFARRGESPASQTCCVPVQTRRKGTRGPVFQNHITMFFGVLAREDAVSIERATAALLEQHAQFLRKRMGDAMNELMHIMSYMPPALYMAFMKLQMRGPFSSFFHSHTGEFAAGLQNFFGARVVNAFHIPGIGTPPGTGIFCNEKNGRLVVTMCWHECALDEAERQTMLEQFFKDLGVS